MNEKYTIAFLLLISLTFSLYFLLSSLLNLRETRRLRDIRLKTKTQRQFGIARNDLFLLLAEDDLADDSITFLFFYMMSTAVMRNPDKYRELAAMMRVTLLGGGEESETGKMLAEESKLWSANTKEMVYKNVHAIGSLMVYHSSILQTIFFGAKFLFPIIRKHFGLVQISSRIIGKIDKPMQTFVESQDQLSGLVRHG